MVKRMRLTLLALSLLLASAACLAQEDTHRYRWVDASGNLHLSDNLPADAAHLGYDLINQYGRVLEHVEGDKSAKDIAAAKKEADAAETARKQQLADQRMLAAYPTEADLIAGQKDHLQLMNLRMDSTRMSMQSQIEGLAGMLDQAAGYSQRGQPVPANLKEEIAAQRKVVQKQRTWIENQEAKIAESAQQFERDLARYRELRGSSAQNNRNRSETTR